ncbi:hypothetical protein MAJ_09533, partial [Metarhizium majus ARSEF 297]
MQLRPCRCFSDLPTEFVSPGDLVDMLETQKNSLKYLELNYLDPDEALFSLDDIPEEDLDTTSLVVQITTNAWYASSNLATFPVLEELHIDEQSFCRHWQTREYVEAEDGPHTCLTDIVPQSLQRLLVWVRPDSRAWDDIHHFCNQVARGCYPNLQRMNLVFHIPDDKIPGSMIELELKRDAPIFIQKAREIKHLLEAFKVVFRAGVLAGDPKFGGTKLFRFLSDDLEKLLDLEILELPFSSKENERREMCYSP